MFSIEYYALPSGKKPAEDFIDSLSPAMKSKAFASLVLLEEFGNELKYPHSAPIGYGLFELRIRFSGDISRIFYFFFDGQKIILTNGYIKKSRKAPKNEIELARRYKADYERRNTK